MYTAKLMFFCVKRTFLPFYVRLAGAACHIFTEVLSPPPGACLNIASIHRCNNTGTGSRHLTAKQLHSYGLKGAHENIKRPSNARQKTAFDNAKDHLLQLKKPPFTRRKATFCKTLCYKAFSVRRAKAAQTVCLQIESGVQPMPAHRFPLVYLWQPQLSFYRRSPSALCICPEPDCLPPRAARQRCISLRAQAPY